MEQNILKHILIGLPSTGKTTFLAALWQVVESREVPGSLLLKELQGDRDHLNSIRDRWLRCEPIDRTVQSAETTVSMKLLNPEQDEIAEVSFPDMSGETFNLHWMERKWSAEYDHLVNEASGVLLFIHPSHVVEPTLICEADELVNELGGNGTCSDDEADEKIIPWNADLAATQVKLVELLQFFMHRKESRPVFRVCVVISAWDLVLSQDESPEKWLSCRLPLLDQYLKSNSELLPSQVFGISAQGGHFPKDADTLRKKLRSSERLIVVGLGYKGNDIGRPLKWLMS